MDNAGKYSHALTAVLYAARKAGCDLDSILNTVKQDIISNSLRPNPLDQTAVIAAVAEAIRDIG
ncbi:hypothetical protein H8K32_19685 [Undibacterium jejuense]|uniref:Uncharacterized protein n=1 Tax=Undibacterium jejuense TaxID=1344949 RepID=A0A923KJJ4_9BURK|nr:hypothetical protein [Undibacterium jejuense]MBC3864327.1 hypothetical protein [Undibacterium jejuense]